MLLASWNLNSLNVRLPHLLDWLSTRRPDVVCLQETKLEDNRFPRGALLEAGYASHYAGQKTYNGVAILTRQSSIERVEEVASENPWYEDAQKRLLSLTAHPAQGAPIRVVCAYVPNGQAVDSEKYDYKLRWLQGLNRWLQDKLNVCPHPRLVLAGDFNVAPADEDVHDPAAWKGKILCSEAERDAWQALLGLGLEDSFRLFEQAEKSFSWWDYRTRGFQRNLGLRIDHILLSGELARRCTGASIDREPRGWERPSDHAPTLAEIDAAAA